MKPIVTDFDVLVQRGFEPCEVRRCLAASHGDVDKAVMLLSHRIDAAEAESWSGNSDADWANHIAGHDPLRAANRALWKSPIYVRVGSHRRLDDGQVAFILSVIMKDGRHFERMKRLSQFISFYDNLPRKLIASLKNKMPKRSVMPWKNSNEGIEKKRVLLEEWMRELCMSEACMSNSDILNNFFRFLEVEEQPIFSASEKHVVVLADYKEDWVLVPEKSLSRLPIEFHSFSAGMPFKVRMATVFAAAADRAMLDALDLNKTDTSDIQLSKDLSRDRIIINGRRIVGAKTKGSCEDQLQALHDILGITEEVVTAVLISSGHQDAFSLDIIRKMCLRALKLASRTYSAFVSHSALHKIADLKSTPDIIIVPESCLAMPIVMKFAVTAPPVPSAPPVLRCELQAATVYRFCTGDDLEPVLQCKVVFCKTFREMPQRKKQLIAAPICSTHPNQTTAVSPSKVEKAHHAIEPSNLLPGATILHHDSNNISILEGDIILCGAVSHQMKSSSEESKIEHDSEAYFILVKETTTSSRDW